MWLTDAVNFKSSQTNSYSMPRGSKGTVIDILTIGIFLFVFFVIVIFSSFILTSTSNTINAGDTGFNTTLMDQANSALGVFNYGFLLLFFGLSAAAILGAYLIDTHPAFFIVSFVLWLFLILLSTVFTDMAFAIAQQAELQATVNNFNIMVLIMLNLPTEMLIIGAVIMIVLFGKGRQ